MKKLALLALLVLIVPAASAFITAQQQVSLQTPLIRQGYEFAKVQGFNYMDTPLEMQHWHIMLRSGLNKARCEMQDTVIQPGPFTVEVTVQCLTQSGLSAIFPINSKQRVETFVPDDTPEDAFMLDKIWIEARPYQPEPFTVIVGHAVSEEPSTAGNFTFLGGIGAIIALAATIILSSLKREE